MAHLPSVIYEATVKPSARLDWGFDWNARGWLDESPDDAIGTVVWTLIDEADSDTPLAGSNTTGATLTGAIATVTVHTLTAGANYILTCKVTLTPSGRIDERSMRLRCRR